jgi:integrase
VNIHNKIFDDVNRERGLLDGFDLYSLRHTFATRFYEATKDLDKLARILGHSNLATVRRYVNPSTADIDRAMERFEEISSCKTGAGSSRKKTTKHKERTPHDAFRDA